MIDPFTCGTYDLSGGGGHKGADDSNEITMTGNLELGDGEISLVIVEGHSFYLALDRRQVRLVAMRRRGAFGHFSVQEFQIFDPTRDG